MSPHDPIMTPARSPDEDPHRATSGEVAKTVLAFGVLITVLSAVIALIIVGGMAPPVAVGTITAASYVAVEVVRRLAGKPPTRLGAAIEAGVQAFLGSAPSAATHAPTLPTAVARADAGQGAAGGDDPQHGGRLDGTP
jgi:hypothetical protein